MADNKLSRVARIEDGFFDENDPLAELARIVGHSDPVERSQISLASRREPEFDLEEELLREFEKFDAPFRNAARTVMNAPKAEEIQPANETSASLVYAEAEAIEPVAQVPIPDEGIIAVEAAANEEPEIVFSAPTFDFSDFELDGEPDQGAIDDPIFSELANVAAFDRTAVPGLVSKPVPSTVPVEPVSAYAEWKTDRLESSSVVLEPAVPAWRADPVLSNPVSLQDALQAELPSALGHDASANVVQTAPVDFVEAKTSGYRSTPDIDDLLADVERYPIGGRSAGAPRLSLATPTLPQKGAYTAGADPVFDEPRDSAYSAAGATSANLAAGVDTADIADPFDASDFHIDFDSIEQELSEIAQVAPSVSHVGHDSLSGWEELASEQQSALHFDPSQIAETEEHVETISDLEVPSLPVVEKDFHVASTPDYYMEIDTEMGNLFAETMDERSKVANSSSANLQGHSAPSLFDDHPDTKMDDFERALEEDFRRSLMDSQSLDAVKRLSATRARMAAADHGDLAENNDGPARSGRSGRFMAAALAGVVMLGGAGYFLWNSTSTDSATATGEPRIILADKEPTKIVPADKGGQTVPNQDKAVYDKVAGADTQDPKQKTLISSAEDPVDVIQKTLAPESESASADLPVATETTDTQDNRLLPTAAQTAETSPTLTGTQNSPTIAPRKVKTMIVRADGTLVQREDAPASGTGNTGQDKPVDVALANPSQQNEVAEKTRVPLPGEAAANVDNTQKQAPLAQTTATTPAAVDALSSEQTTAGKNDTRLATNGNSASETGTSADSVLDAANADVPLTVPARKVKTTTTILGKAPVPTTRPADQPVNVVGTVTENGNVVANAAQDKTSKQAQASNVEEPVQVASVQPVASGGSYGMQVASFPSEDEAKRAVAGLKSKYGGFLAGQGLEIRKAEIPGKGTRYRVRVPVGSKDAAAALCVKYRSAGGSCLVSK